MDDSRKAQWEKHFAILREKQTWKNLVYLLLAFPLGIAYFVLSITGLSAGIPLMIVWIGFFILFALFAVWWGLALFERQLARVLLDVEIAPASRPTGDAEGVVERLVAYLKNPTTWKSALYLLFKFPMGIASFVVTVTVLSVTGGLVFAPFVYQSGDINIFAWQIDTFVEAIIAAGIGLYLAPFAFRVLNGMAQLSGQIAELMLGDNRVPAEKKPEDIWKTA